MKKIKQNRILKIITCILKVIIMILLTIIIFFNSVIIVDGLIHKGEVPSFFGWKPFIVSSGSMESKLYMGDIAIVKEVDVRELEVGDIIAFQESPNFIVTHRIIEKITDEDGQIKFITKGDNNNATDLEQVLVSQLEGKYITKISKLGNLLLYMQTPIGTIISISIPIIILLILYVIENRNNSKYMKKQQDQNEVLKQEIEKLKQENEQLKK